MALINPKKKEFQVKIVYYGPGRGGKTTNLEYINKRFKKRIQNEMVTVKTYGDPHYPSNINDPAPYPHWINSSTPITSAPKCFIA